MRDLAPILSHPVAIVVLARYWEIFTGFLDSVEEIAPDIPKILVRDPSDEPWPQLGGRWRTIMGPEKFSMAGNANLGVKAAPADCDVLYCGDDIRFPESGSLERLQAIAYAHPEVGILSPRLDGRASVALGHPGSECDWVLPLDMWFPCVYVKRELIDRIGYWDEQFDSFGDDFDYSVRALFAGYRLAVTTAVTVEHGKPGPGGPPTFVRKGGTARHAEQKAETHAKLAAKYGVTRDRLAEYVRTGELAILQPPAIVDTKIGAAS